MTEFSGSERTVARYLLEEVLEQQPPEVRAASAAHVDPRPRERPVGRPPHRAARAAERVLQELEDANAFVSSLDVARSWFRYHHLFADLLQLELRRIAPEAIARPAPGGGGVARGERGSGGGRAPCAGGARLAARGAPADDEPRRPDPRRSPRDRPRRCWRPFRPGSARGPASSRSRSPTSGCATARQRRPRRTSRLHEASAATVPAGAPGRLRDAAGERRARVRQPPRRPRAHAGGDGRARATRCSRQTAGTLEQSHDIRALALMSLGIDRAVGARGGGRAPAPGERRSPSHVASGGPYLEIGCLADLAIAAPLSEPVRGRGAAVQRAGRGGGRGAWARSRSRGGARVRGRGGFARLARPLRRGRAVAGAGAAGPAPGASRREPSWRRITPAGCCGSGRVACPMRSTRSAAQRRCRRCSPASTRSTVDLRDAHRARAAAAGRAHGRARRRLERIAVRRAGDGPKRVSPAAAVELARGEARAGDRAARARGRADGADASPTVGGRARAAVRRARPRRSSATRAPARNRSSGRSSSPNPKA